MIFFGGVLVAFFLSLRINFQLHVFDFIIEIAIRIFFGLLYWVLVNFLNKFNLCQLRIVPFLWLILQELLDNLGVFLRLADIGRRFDILIIETAFPKEVGVKHLPNKF